MKNKQKRRRNGSDKTEWERDCETEIIWMMRTIIMRCLVWKA